MGVGSTQDVLAGRLQLLDLAGVTAGCGVAVFGRCWF